MFRIVFLLLLPAVLLMAREDDPAAKRVPDQPAAIALSSSLVSANNTRMWIRNDGKSANSPTNRSGFIFPSGTSHTVFLDGIMWGGRVLDGQFSETLRVGGQSLRVGTQPGAILAPGVPAGAPDSLYRVYRLWPDWQNLDSLTLLQQAADLNETDTSLVTAQMIAELTARLARDENNWPADLGAPFVDENGNRVWDPGIDTPGIRNAAQTLWFVCNDLDSLRTRFHSGSPPVGLELQVTLWSYSGIDVLQDVVFKRYRFIYRGATSSTPSTARIEDMYVSQWADTDIGLYIDDLSGCDSSRNLAYGYNGSASDDLFSPFNLKPPAFGYRLLQGPFLESPGDTADFDFRRLPGYRNVPMTSFAYFSVGSSIPGPTVGNYDATLMWYNVMRGFLPVVQDSLFYLSGSGANEGMPTRFPLSGDPVSMLGDVDGLGNNLPPGDRRMALSSGPFTLALGDTQEIIVAAIGGAGPNYLDNVDSLKQLSDTIARFFSDGFEIITGLPEGGPAAPAHFSLAQNYPNPFNPQTRIVYTLQRRSVLQLEVFNALGQRVRVLFSGSQAAGKHQLVWDGRNSSGTTAGSGIYFYRLTVEGRSLSRKMLLLH